MAIQLIQMFQADTGRWYLVVDVHGIRQEFKFQTEPTEVEFNFAVAEVLRQSFPIINSPILKEINPNGLR